MILQPFFNNFALLADAPNGVSKLRELILQLAVQGKLIAQHSNEEPAREVLKRIRVEKERLVRDGKSRKTTSSNNIESKDIPFVLPPMWEWVRLGDLCELENGDRSKNYPSRAEFVANGIPFINAGHLQSGAICMESMNYIPERRFNLLKSGKVKDGDILFCLRGSLGKSALVKRISQGAVASSLVIIRLLGDLNRQFVLNYLFSPLTAQMIKRFDNGTAQPNLSSGDLGKFLFPLPPLEEQKRIVAKVDELMRLCDELKARQQARHASRVHLNNATLAPLNNAASLAPEEFEQASVRLADNFAALYDSAETVSRLRSTILQLAVQGKLVSQDPHDEPASALIASITKEKARLFEERSIKRDKQSFSIDESDIPFHLPAGWEWARIANVITLKSGSTLAPDLELSEGQIPYLKVGDMNLAGNEQVITKSSRYVRKSPAIIKDLIPANSIIFPKRGGAIATNKKRLVRSEILVDSNTMAMICHEPMPLEYLHLWFMTVDLWQLNSGTSVPQINNKDLEPLLMQVPPLEEQKRIVAIVNQLMALCAELENKLRQTEADSGKLMSAAVRQVLDAVAGQEKSQRETALALSST